MKNDDLGTRMKESYEQRYKIKLPRRTNTIIRIDGKAFHSYTRGLKKPFDTELMDDLDQTAIYLCQNIQGAKFAYVQSDEISIVLTDYATITTDAWFDGNVQKMASISASLATAKFNDLRSAPYYADLGVLNCIGDDPNEAVKPSLACFDSRVFVIPELTEVYNYFIWRQQDATRNSIQMVGQANFSHKELQGVNCNKIQEKLFQEKGINWNDTPTDCKRGRGIYKRTTSHVFNGEVIYRSEWIVDKEIPIFTQNKEYLESHITKAWL
jgi:tRNA(His) 5'-end guanylyltransferase